METPAALVVGAGVGGMKAALELAACGIKVYLLERSAHLGGEISQLERQFPTNRCCLCQMLPTYDRDSASQYCLRRDLYHPLITLLSQAEVERVEGRVFDFRVGVRLKSRLIREERCIGCGECAEVCPVEVRDEFNRLSVRKAIYIKYPQAIPNTYTIDREHCTRCGMCVARCPTGAIDLSLTDELKTLTVGALILAAGFEEFDPALWTSYGYRRYPNVVTSLELERMLSEGGPFQGRPVRPSDQAPLRKVAFLHCIGSRTREYNYCSTACCMYAMKEAMLLKEINPAIDITLFYMDLRTFGKGYHRYYLKAKDTMGIRFICSRVPNLKHDPSTGNLSLTFVDEEGCLKVDDYDLVVLAIGQRPPRGQEQIIRLLGLKQNEWGFLTSDSFSSVDTGREGIYQCGPISGPRDIPDTICQATAAAFQVATLLSSVPKMVEQPLAESAATPAGEPEEPRMAIFLCSCGGEISERLDLELLTQLLHSRNQVVGVERVTYLCLDDTLTRVQERIKELRANRVLFASCVPYSYERKYRQMLKDAGLDPHFMELVNLREQVTWVHPEEREAVQKKALSMVVGALEKLRHQEPLSSQKIPVHPQVLVIGGGLAGLVSSLSLSRRGIEVHLVERTSVLGGNLTDKYYTLEGKNPQILLTKLKEEIRHIPHLHLYLESEVVTLCGQMGDFKTTIVNRSGEKKIISHGALIIATGGREKKPHQYGYGKSERIITQKELEKRIALNREMPRSVMMIQCVESRDAERPYCSRVCCSQAIANALRIKEKSPGTEVTVLYRDIMTYGFKETHYSACREKGVTFIRYRLGNNPRVSLQGGLPRVELDTPDLNCTLRFSPELLVLSSGVVPHDQVPLARVLNLPLDEDGFFKEAEVKFRPVDALTEGIYICGLAHSPLCIEETIVQAQAAAHKAWALLSKTAVETSRLVSSINERRCSLCELCISACPYQARIRDQEERRIIVREALCQGCGACALVCPNGAAQLKGYREGQMLSMVDALLSAG